MASIDGSPNSEPIDRLIVQLRAYVPKARSDWQPNRAWTSNITVTFDTETTTDPSQRLRFGAYQVRHDGGLLERGLFLADDLSEKDRQTLHDTFAAERPTDAGEQLAIRTRAEFVEEVLFKWGLDAGGLIIGFNLPFDLSRIAERHTYAKNRMKGGFSFRLVEGRPNVTVRHRSQRSSFISFAGADGKDHTPDRGFFVDVKTLAAALTSQSHSLQSLTRLLGTTPKSPLESYEGDITPEMVRYCLNDVQCTWECFAALKTKYDGYGLSAGLFDLYSEASLGKAFLRRMNIKPWQAVQAKFPPEIIGKVLSTYYGGRAEVRLRRMITPVIHCDFLSMYPTVCTLMGLWRFVIANGVNHTDDTLEVQRFVETVTLDHLQDPATWRKLTAIVQVLPSEDVFPVRAVYPGEGNATIGLNYLTAKEPMWFTLADVVASKLLSGKAPKIISAIRFEPHEPQDELSSIKLEGETFDPRSGDFYKRIIEQRKLIQALEKKASGDERAHLSSAQQALKILANSTSYGIFVELNVRELEKAAAAKLYDFRGAGRKISARKIEEPGAYFHPLLGALITGAARLMLALAERNALDRGLDWAFCDTDSLAIANTSGLSADEFKKRVETVRAWFKPLNPYGGESPDKPSILQLEKVNFPTGCDGQMDKLRPTNCLAISAKRYVLFDREADGEIIIRKASAHGLGHLIAPYPDPDRGARIGRIGVELWQEDLWKLIIAAAYTDRPDEVEYGALRNCNQPAASRYAATNPALLGWFKAFNETVPDAEKVRPFNFLLSYQAKSKMEMASVDPGVLHGPMWRKRQPNPASRYSSDLINDRPPVFDRRTGESIPWEWLKSISRSLARHHLHAEMKFRGGSEDERGPLQRRHVEAWAVIPIGKEADNLEEREFLGEGGDAVEWQMQLAERTRILADVDDILRANGISDAELCRRAGVSHHTLSAMRKSGRASQQSVLNVATAAEQLRHEVQSIAEKHDRIRELAVELAGRLGSVNKLALRIGVTRQFLNRVMKGERSVTEKLAVAIERLAVENILELSSPRGGVYAWP